MKRCVSVLLALILLLTLVPFSACAEGSDMMASEAIINYIKSCEGCRLTAYKAVPEETYYTIGYGHYGTDVTPGMTISQYEADMLLLYDISQCEDALNAFADTRGFTFTQNEFDALISMAFNFGANFLTTHDGEWRFCTYICSGNWRSVADQEIADSMGVLATAGGTIYSALIKRRIAEARIFLYGDYTGTGPNDFIYLILDANGGTLTRGNRIAIYTKGQPFGALPGVTKSGFTLDYWQSSSGVKINANTIASEHMTLTAVWKSGTPVGTKYSVTVTNGFGSGEYEPGEKVIINPDVPQDYDFTGWTSGDISIMIDADQGYFYFIMPSKNVSITANIKHVQDELTPSERFLDVGSDYWAAAYIDFVVENGLFSGYSERTFGPTETMNRAMLVTVLHRLCGSPDVSELSMPFTDVDKNGYYNGILWGSNAGITSGYYDGTFRPYQTLSRQQLVTMLMRYAEGQGYDITARADLSAFTDSDSIAAYASDALSWAVASGIISGTSSTTLSPESGASRAQVAAILTRFVNNVVCE